MTKGKLKLLAGSVIFASMIGGLALPAYAQNYTTAYYDATTNTLSTEGKIALLQTQVIVLFGRIVGNISAQASTSAELAEPVRRLQLAWIGLALNQMSIIRARLGL